MLQKRTHERHRGGGVLVAVSESPSASDTLGWAACYARTTALPLHAVHVLETGWEATPEFETAGPTQFPRLGAPGAIALSPVTLGETGELNPEAETAPDVSIAPAMVREAFESVVPEQRWTLEVVDVVVAGCVGPLLVEHAADESLLVVGRGRCRTLRRLLSGSVSHYCLSHATVPVLAVTPDRSVNQSVRPRGRSRSL